MTPTRYSLTLAVGLALALGGRSSAQTAGDLRGDVPNEAEGQALWTAYRAAGATAARSPGGAPTQIAVQVHIIGNDAGESDRLDATRVGSLLESANARFAGAGIELVQCAPVNRIASSAWRIFNRDDDERDLRRAHDRSGAINVYFAQTVQTSSTTVAGYAYYPYAQTLLDGSNFTILRYNAGEEVFAHELGHSFGLIHTHGYLNPKASTAELVDGSNCETTGDNVCDTPADPKAWGRLDGCRFDAAAAGNLRDANGDLYAPDASNLMAYSPGRCQERFTPEQLDAVAWTAENYYALARCAGGEAPEPGDAPPAITAVSVEAATLGGNGAARLVLEHVATADPTVANPRVIDAVTFATSAALTTYRHEFAGVVAADRLRVRFANDARDRDLLVTEVTVGGRTYPTRAASTYSTGTWKRGPGCAYEGYAVSDRLHCNGYFHYDAGGAAARRADAPGPRLAVAPNPTDADERVYVTVPAFDDARAVAEVWVTDLAGRLVAPAAPANAGEATALDVELPAGTYVVVARAGAWTDARLLVRL